ncbi:F0F1 ATP synthase subunit epsilon [Pseudohoeflea coraliihabitans]|uniref:ATP synthase epsilon chain n=1 Tax=Pseudohoeflea coraliihabitans TaxID=2860393 RepID=A0ABS6WL68_9HYPH|nr:F0F1 ATP synthase subunit epsilon [Pseudohoeflea sp. DP4N28-3]MBW3096711.1 F0F1 ATP synthase subunit epsilon [Pseudohoeflea sp. DP4N28-3]
MANSFTFELVSPEQLLVSREITSVVIPGSEGDMTVMADHAPTMATIRPGIVTLAGADGQEDRYVVFGGFADILPDACTVLAESAIHVDAIDAEMIKAQIASAEKAVVEAQHDVQQQKAREFLDQLTTLQGAILPA